MRVQTVNNFDACRVTVLRCYIRTAKKFQDLGETDIESACLRWGEKLAPFFKAIDLVREKLVFCCLPISVLDCNFKGLCLGNDKGSRRDYYGPI